MANVIAVENISKRYLIQHQHQRHSNLRDVIADGSRRFAARLKNPFAVPPRLSTTEEFWALNGVTFDVPQGSRVGIVGRNGAGKSTLLKILSRITEPSGGQVTIKGRVASLLEVGTGFHPELSGRENIFLNGAILGMSRSEISAKFDQIVAFAEVERFLDTPVKRYSSGMYVRLAFAVAAHLEPEVLIVDEVLAVGDAQFQKKCLGRMDEIGREGRTVLFVSHNMGMIRTLCDRAILLDKGEVTCEGETNVVLAEYFSSGSSAENTGEISWPGPDAPGSDGLLLRRCHVSGPEGQPQEEFDANSPINIQIDYELTRPLRGIRINLMLVTDEGIAAFLSSDESTRQRPTLPAGHYFSRCTIPPALLNVGQYSIRLYSDIFGEKILVHDQPGVTLSVVGAEHSHGTLRPEKWPGVLAPKLNWTVGEKAPGVGSGSFQGQTASEGKTWNA